MGENIPVHLLIVFLVLALTYITTKRQKENNTLSTKVIDSNFHVYLYLILCLLIKPWGKNKLKISSPFFTFRSEMPKDSLSQPVSLVSHLQYFYTQPLCIIKDNNL